MAYDEGLAQRVREVIESEPGFVEKEMFGGIAFLLHGNMACGVSNDDSMVRVGPDQYKEALTQPDTRVFDLTGRPMKGWVLVAPGVFESDSDLKAWVERGSDFALSLPAK